jgi:hypothetical protein
MRTLVLLLLLLASPAWAQPGPQNASNFGQPMTLNSVNYAPDTTGIPLGDYDGVCTANIVKTSGTFSVNVEGKLKGGDFASMGTVTSTSLVTIEGPLEYIRFNVTACSSCLGTAVLRCRVGP